ncbi:hypothetical protein [Neoroseomonas soli]|uniref:Uncharacterized protein n=1 Tax=Neoroseomonas soli TaxID=1081025 RepID=A0A9X9WXE8_9PROT|nr:hypothetical protein [Neoroseomonas soli]MBR0671827.1 hypothetical protein [Neoroseomonas soli]
MNRTTPPSADAERARQTTALLAAFEAMEGTLSVAEALLAGRRRIDLSGLENEMGRLCAASLLAPAEALPTIRTRLEALRLALDRLEAGLPRP